MQILGEVSVQSIDWVSFGIGLFAVVALLTLVVNALSHVFLGIATGIAKIADAINESIRVSSQSRVINQTMEYVASRKNDVIEFVKLIAGILPEGVEGKIVGRLDLINTRENFIAQWSEFQNTIVLANTELSKIVPSTQTNSIQTFFKTWMELLKEDSKSFQDRKASFEKAFWDVIRAMSSTKQNSEVKSPAESVKA